MRFPLGLCEIAPGSGMLMLITSPQHHILSSICVKHYYTFWHYLICVIGNTKDHPGSWLVLNAEVRTATDLGAFSNTIFYDMWFLFESLHCQQNWIYDTSTIKTLICENMVDVQGGKSVLKWSTTPYCFLTRLLVAPPVGPI